MGLVRFNDSGKSSGTSLLYRMKPLPITTQLYGDGTTNTWRVPVIRAGAGDKSFGAVADTGVTLYTTAATGISTTTATITYTTYLTNSNGVSAHLNSADQCLYVLVYESPSWRFIKINDTTGVVTTIGAAFTPVTTANWPTNSSSGAMMEVDAISGHLKITFNGFYHLVDKTTGAIVSQDTAISLGSFLARRVFYVTQDGSVGIGNGGHPGVGTGNSQVSFPNFVHSTYGHISGYVISKLAAGNIGTETDAFFEPRNFMLVDTDKVFHSTLFDATNTGAKLYLRTDFDKFVKSAAELGAGVI